MKSNQESLQHHFIDGQHIIIPSFEDWQLLKSDPFIDGDEVSFINSSYLWRTLECANRYSELKIGLGYLSKTWRVWMHYAFRCMGSKMQRVHLEFLQCYFCDWKGWSANPLVSDAYFGEGVHGTYFQLVKAIDRYSIYPCPKCGQRLPRYSIWVEY